MSLLLPPLCRECLIALQCDIFVKEYAHLIVQYILDGLKPNQVCSAIGKLSSAHCLWRYPLA